MSFWRDTEADGADGSTGRGWYGEWIPRLAAGTVVIAACWFGAIWVFGSTTGFLVTIVISAFVSFALLPAVERLANRGWRRGAATGLVMVVALLVAGVFVFAITGVVIDQIVALVRNLPDYAESVTVWLNESFGLDVDLTKFVEELSTSDQQLQSVAGNVAGGVFGLAGTILGLVFQALTVGLFVFYILADLPRLRATINRRFPPHHQEYIDTITTITIDKVGGWVYSRTVLAFFSAVFHLVAFMVIGLPYAVALALWVGVVSQFVPTVGTYIAGVAPLLVALLDDPKKAIWVVVIIVVYQQIENYAISPKVTANTMELHPAVAFGSAIVGASLLGGLGAVLALPFAAAVVALMQTYTDHYELIHSETIESPEAYSERMQDIARDSDRHLSIRERLARITDGDDPPQHASPDDAQDVPHPDARGDATDG